MAIIGYIRVSTVEQNLDRQQTLMEKIHTDKVFQDKASGKNLHRPGFEEMMNYLRFGDEVHIESFSRLSRSTAELLQTVNLLKEKGVALVSHKENFDTSTPSGKLMLTVFAALAEFERETMLERQREGIEEAKKKGVYKGRARIPDSPELMIAMKGWASGDLSAADAIRISGLGKTSFYKRCKENGYIRNKQ